MKKIQLYILCLVAVATGCKKLDQEPQSTGPKSAIFGSEQGLQLYVRSFYNFLPTANDVVRADNMSDYAARTDVTSFLTANGFGAGQGSGWSWTGLRNINYFIENCNNPTIAESSRTNFIATARFFRALFYFGKIQYFGSAPWYSNSIPLNDTVALYKPRNSRQLIMDSVLADLDFAANNITTTDNSRSLITKFVALAYKSRICLFEGTFRKYHSASGGLAEGLGNTANTWLTQAAEAAKKVIAEGGFSLNTLGGVDAAYRQLFNSKAPVTKEIILSNICDVTQNVLNDANWYWTSATYGARLSFSRTFVNTYLNIDGKAFTATPGYETKSFMDEVKNRDKRLQQTIRMGDYKRNIAGSSKPAPPVFSYTYTGYQPIKWTLDDDYFDGGTRNDNSISLIRFAEILLNYAEAKAELGSLTDADWATTIGALRTRAGITGGINTKPAVVDAYLQTNYFPNITDPVILEIRRERGIELSWEGLRFADLMRWKKGELLTIPWKGFYVAALNTPIDLNEDGTNDVLFYQGAAPAQISYPGVTFINVSAQLSNGSVNPQQLSNGTSGEITWLNNVSRVWDNKKYLYPIPTNDLNRNPALGQNPGW